MKAKKTIGYECSNCGQVHREEQEALECCPPQEVEGWICGECDEFYEDKEDAKECCR